MSSDSDGSGYDFLKHTSSTSSPTTTCTSLSLPTSTTPEEDALRHDLAVCNFLAYLRIPTPHPDPNYDEAVEFLENIATDIGLPYEIYHPVDPRKPVVVISWVGSQPELPSILLNSNMDVGPASAEHWTNGSPFEAVIDPQNDIYARGTQDGKCVGIQYLEAIRGLHKYDKKINKRTIHVSFVPDEEIGGDQGMKSFVKSDEFKALNVGFALGKGLANSKDSFSVFYGERTSWKVQVHCPGNSGHGSRLIDKTPSEKLRVVLDRFHDFRFGERAKLLYDKLPQGGVSSINLLRIEGGKHNTVIPSNITATFDISLSSEIDPEEFEVMMKLWCDEAGEDVHHSFLTKDERVEDTKIDDGNPYWAAFRNACLDENLNLELGISPTPTDARHIRAAGIPAIGFSPLSRTRIRIHSNEEYLNSKVFFRGVKIYENIISQLGNF